LPPFNVVGTTPVLLFGERDQMRGEVWLSNPTTGSIGVSGGSVLVNFASPETGTISFPANAAIPAGATRRLGLNLGIAPFTPPGTYTATITLNTAAGIQTIASTAIVASVFLPALGPTSMTFTGVTASSTINGSIVVRNRGNTTIAVNTIPNETLVEIVVSPGVLQVGAGGSLSVAPAPGLTTGGTVTFTNATPTINPGDWADVDFQLTTPAALAANSHFRVLPRITTERFAVDLLT